MAQRSISTSYILQTTYDILWYTCQQLFQNFLPSDGPRAIPHVLEYGECDMYIIANFLLPDGPQYHVTCHSVKINVVFE